MLYAQKVKLENLKEIKIIISIMQTENTFPKKLDVIQKAEIKLGLSPRKIKEYLKLMISQNVVFEINDEVYVKKDD